jgi:AraC-like DNA-binding protein
MGSLFAELRLGASLTDGTQWRGLHALAVNIASLELARGLERKRELHNARSIELARRSGRSVLAEHSGYYDLFVPIGAQGRFGCLVTGQFALRRPGSSELLSVWRDLTGTHGRASDPEFSHFVSVALETATFNPAQLDAFRRSLECLCGALAEQGEVRALVVEMDALRRKLAGVRFSERIWEIAGEMVDPRLWRGWLSPHRMQTLTEVGLKRFPENAAVGLLLGKGAEADPIEDVLKRDAFLRAAVELCRKQGGALSGRVGDHGVSLLLDDSGPRARRVAKLRELCDRATALARRHGLRLHMGLALPGAQVPLPRCFQVALAAAERALSQGLSLISAGPGRDEERPVSMADLRGELARAVGGDPQHLSPRFDRYIEVVAVRTGYRLEPFRTQLEAGFEKVADALRANAALDDRSFAEMQEMLNRSSGAATLRDVSEAYRRVISALELAMRRPTLARQDRNLRRAIDYMREHAAERLTLPQVARIAGFAPNYFTKLLSENERSTFRQYLTRLRLLRAKQMLVDTTLSAERVGKLCGFPTRTTFYRAFLSSMRVTPNAYRRSTRVLP